MKFLRRKAISVSSILVFFLTLFFFLIPFFWLKSGFVDMGSDGGRLYFIEPLWAIQSILNTTDFTKLYWLASTPHIFFLSVLKYIIQSTTLLMCVEHGLHLSLSFLFMYLVIRELLGEYGSEKKTDLIAWVGIVGGIVYIGFITVRGWPLAFLAHNQVFLNPLLFFLLLRYCLTRRIGYCVGILAITLCWSGNFGFGTSPQVFSFFPLALVFLFFYTHLLLHKPFPWKGLLLLGVCFIGLHAFHIVPLVASILEKGGIQGLYLSSEATGNRGVSYFDYNHIELGKLSLQIFQPSQWNGKTLAIFLVPVISFLGFLKKPSKLLLLVGVFFAVTFFLVSANITHIGIQLYRLLFSIPGFLMFRSFNEKWYFVYVFFFSLLFAISMYHLCMKRRMMVALLVGCLVIVSIIFRTYPFWGGKGIHTVYWQSDNVSPVFKTDPDLLDAISNVRMLPNDGNFLTLPLAAAFQQIAYGKEGGAYVGISIVQNLGGRKDFSGFLTFGPYEQYVSESFRQENTHTLLELFSLLNVRYVFYNADSRIMDKFPAFPYVSAGTAISSKDQFPIIADQEGYGRFLSSLPLTNVYSKGFYHIFRLDENIVRPTVYIPDMLYASVSDALNGASLRSAFIDETACRYIEQYNIHCDGIWSNEPLPDISFIKRSNNAYDVSIDPKGRQDPFLVVLSSDYHPSWEMDFGGIKPAHIRINGYANAWIVDPKIKNGGSIEGTIRMGFERYYTYGIVISIITVVLLVVGSVYKGIWRRHEKK